MTRSEFIDKIEEIQNRNDNRFVGINESELITREEIADLVFSNFKPAISQENTCGSCQKFKGDGPEFQGIGICVAGQYQYSKKSTDICDNIDNFKKKK